MAKRTGIKLLDTSDGVMTWDFLGTRVILNTNNCPTETNRQAMFAGYHRAMSNMGAGKDKMKSAAIVAEAERRKRGFLNGMWKVNVGGYGFSDHVEAIVRIETAAGRPVSYEEVSDLLMSKTQEQRTAHAANPRVHLVMLQIQTERMELAVAEDDDGVGSILSGLE